MKHNSLPPTPLPADSCMSPDMFHIAPVPPSPTLCDPFFFLSWTVFSWLHALFFKYTYDIPPSDRLTDYIIISFNIQCNLFIEIWKKTWYDFY